MPTQKKYNIAIIGFGRMGELYLQELLAEPFWHVAYICDIDQGALDVARQLAPSTTKTTTDAHVIFTDPSVDVVVLTTLANARKEHFQQAIAYGKHVITEKPVGATREEEEAIQQALAQAPILVTVNLPLRNAWYHKEIKAFIDAGQMGELAIIRVCHMTPGLAPGEGHWAEGPIFHDCGMHYVDIARWYAQSEFKTWHAQALRMWSYPQPWWLQCHGTFENGMVFDVTEGHVYGQLAKDLIHNSYVDLIGTKGIARMSHDYITGKVELHGTDRTDVIERPFGDKNLDVLCSGFARSLDNGRLDPSLPCVADAVTASKYAWLFLEDAATHDVPAVGNLDTLHQIHVRREEQRIGYGLLPKR